MKKESFCLQVIVDNLNVLRVNPAVQGIMDGNRMKLVRPLTHKGNIFLLSHKGILKVFLKS